MYKVVKRKQGEEAEGSGNILRQSSASFLSTLYRFWTWHVLEEGFDIFDETSNLAQCVRIGFWSQKTVSCVCAPARVRERACVCACLYSRTCTCARVRLCVLRLGRTIRARTRVYMRGNFSHHYLDVCMRACACVRA